MHLQPFTEQTNKIPTFFFHKDFDCKLNIQ